MLEDVDSDKMMVSSVVFSDEKIYKYFICYTDEGHKIKPLHICFQKQVLMLKVMKEKPNECFFY